MKFVYYAIPAVCAAIISTGVAVIAADKPQKQIVVAQGAPASKPPNAPATDFVDAKIVADVSSAAPGKPFRVGVLFTMKPDWHIYWKNPGESGFETSIKWKANPSSTKFGELKYPAPIMFEMPGPLISYGYGEEVLLFTEVTPPADAKEVEISGDAKWLMCSDRCIPGKKSVGIKIPVGEAKPANDDIFKKYAAQVPTTTGDVKAKIATSKEGDNYVTKVTIDPAGKQLLAGGDHGYKMYFFPDPLKGYTAEAPEVSKPDGQAAGNPAYTKPATVTIKIIPEKADAPAPKVTGVLTYQLPNAPPKAVVVQ